MIPSTPMLAALAVAAYLTSGAVVARRAWLGTTPGAVETVALVALAPAVMATYAMAVASPTFARIVLDVSGDD